MVDFNKLLAKKQEERDRQKLVFTPDQQEAYDAVCSGKNVCITGPAGTGKSTLLNALREAFKGGLDVTASTGIAALNVSGITVHSWAGLGLGDDPTNYIVSQILQRRKVVYRIRNCRRLAIDEISMMSAPLLTKLSEVLSAVRDDPRPFGGIQMLFIGDFLQLPPVSRGAFVGFAFASPEWARAEVEVHELTTIVRQKDAGFASILNKIRVGTIDHEVAAFFESRVAAVDADTSARPVELEGRNIDVDFLNRKELDKLPADLCRAVAKDWSDTPAFLDRLKKDCIAPEILDLKIGAQVMCLKNINPDCGVVNGSVGVLLDFEGVDEEGNEGLPRIRFKNYTQTIPVSTWELKDGQLVVARREQFPLRLAWAITIHKCIDPMTLVETPEGLRRAGDLGLVMGGSIGTAFGFKPYRNFVAHPPRAALRVTTKHGYQITMTPDHGMMCSDGKRRAAQDLKQGVGLRIIVGSNETASDRMVSLPEAVFWPNAKKYRAPLLLGLNEAEFLGLIVGDGTVYKAGFRLAKRHADVVERFAWLCGALFDANAKRFVANGAYQAEVNSRSISRWLINLGGTAPNKKAVPECVLLSQPDVQRAFLRGLFEDGSAHVKRGHFSHVEWSTASEQMSKDVHVMLLRSGILSSRVKRVALQGGATRVTWRIWIYGRDAALFRDTIGFVSAAKNFRLASAGSSKRVSRVVKDSIFIDGVETIESVVAPSVCVEVPSLNRFNQNGFDGCNSQGMTLDKLKANLSDFDAGMTYVALSRARTAEGIFLKNVDACKIRAHPDAVAFYKNNKRIKNVDTNHV